MNAFKMIFILALLQVYKPSWSQDNTTTCKVLLNYLNIDYKGGCKKGLADGQGEAKGLRHRYVGLFQNGLPNGNGTYYYSDSVYYTGNFQDGIKEGKGETHYTKYNKPDSIIKGYWSGDEFKGKKYTTYLFKSETVFNHVDINSAEGGGLLAIEISTTSGGPDGTITGFSDVDNKPTGNSGYVLTLDELATTDGKQIRQLSKTATAKSTTVMYQLSSFPAKLAGIFSNGNTVILELYKKANWTIKLNLNK